MKYGLNLLLWTTDVNDRLYPLFEKIKDWGYDGVELPVFEMNRAAFAAAGDRLRDIGLECTAVTVGTPDENPISPDAAKRQAGLDRIKRAVEMCQAAGATHLCGPFHSALGEFTGTGPTREEWNRGRETLSRAADFAQQAGVTLTLEYLNRFECYFLNCAEDTARFCREVNHSHLKMMYDTFHANIEEKCIAAAVRACADQLVHVHISENDRSTPGEGAVDWDASFQALKDVKYDGWLMIEAFGLALPALAAATKIWRRMFPSEEHLATEGLRFMKSRWEG